MIMIYLMLIPHRIDGFVSVATFAAAHSREQNVEDKREFWIFGSSIELYIIHARKSHVCVCGCVDAKFTKSYLYCSTLIYRKSQYDSYAPKKYMPCKLENTGKNGARIAMPRDQRPQHSNALVTYATTRPGTHTHTHRSGLFFFFLFHSM